MGQIKEISVPSKLRMSFSQDVAGLSHWGECESFPGKLLRSVQTQAETRPRGLKGLLIPLKGEKIPCNSFQFTGSPWPLAGDSFSPSENQNECKSSSDTSSQVSLLLILK